MKKPTLAKFNGTLPAKMLAALCLLNCVGAVTPPETHPSVTSVKTGEGVAYAPWWMPTLMGAANPSGNFTTKASLQTAVEAYNANPTTATKTYGPIAGCDVSMITDMYRLFYGLTNFNADISSWDTSKVTTMFQMFQVRPARALRPPSLESGVPRACRLRRRRPTPSRLPGAHLSPRIACPSFDSAVRDGV